MINRTIPALIGWVRRPTDEWEARAYGPEVVVTPDGQRWLPSKRPDVDDLLAWLRQRATFWNIGNAYDADTDEYSQWQVAGFGDDLTDDGDCEPIVEATGPTLLAALEAAVRAVAGVPT